MTQRLNNWSGFIYQKQLPVMWERIFILSYKIIYIQYMIYFFISNEKHPAFEKKIKHKQFMELLYIKSPISKSKTCDVFLRYSSILHHGIEIAPFFKQVARRIKFHNLSGIKHHYPGGGEHRQYWKWVVYMLAGRGGFEITSCSNVKEMQWG